MHNNQQEEQNRDAQNQILAAASLCGQVQGFVEVQETPLVYWVQTTAPHKVGFYQGLEGFEQLQHMCRLCALNR